MEVIALGIVITVLVGSVCGIVAVARTGSLATRVLVLERKLGVARRRERQEATVAEVPIPPRPRAPAEAPAAKAAKFVRPLATPEAPPAPKPVKAVAPAKMSPPADAPTAPDGARSKRPEPRKATAAKPRRTLEETIGLRWMAWVGAAILLAGVGYFMKYAYDHAWVSEAGRLAIAGVIGAVAVVAGHMARFRRLGAWADVITGLGFAIWYVCVYFAFDVYGLWSQSRAFPVAIGVTGLAITSAVKRDSWPICLLALLGGYASPVLLSTGENRAVELFTYITILNAAALGCAVFRRWRVIDVVAWVGTAAIGVGWYLKYYEASQFPIACTFLAVFQGMFLVLPVLNGLVTRRKCLPESLLLSCWTTTMATLGYHVLMGGDRGDLTTAYLVQAAGVMALLGLVRWRIREDGVAQRTLVVQAAGLLVAVVPVAFDMWAVPTAWAIESVVFAYAARVWRTREFHLAAVVAQGFALYGLVARLPLHTEAFTPFLNVPFATWMLVAATSLAGGWLLPRDHEVGKGLAPAFRAVGLMVLGAVMHMEVSTYWQHAGATWGAVAAEAHRAESLVLLWAVLSGTAAMIARSSRSPALGVVTALVMFIGGVVVVVEGSSYPLFEAPMFFNMRFLAAAVFAGACALSVRLMRDLKEMKDVVRIVNLAAAALMAIVVHTEVTRHWFAHLAPHGTLTPRLLEPLTESLTVAWSVMIALGAIVLKRRATRATAGAAAALLVAGTGVVLWSLIRHPGHDGWLFMNTRFSALAMYSIAVGMLAHAWRGLGPTARLVSRCLGALAVSSFAMNLHIDLTTYLPTRYTGETLTRYHFASTLPLWSVIGATLAGAAWWLRERWLGYCALGALAYGGVILTSSVLDYPDVGAMLFLNLDFGTRLLFCLAAPVTAMLAWAAWDETRGDALPVDVRQVCIVMANVFLAALVGLEIVRWGDNSDLTLPLLGTVSHAFAVGMISAAWSVQALCLILWGLRRDEKVVRIVGVVLFGVVVGKVLLIDTQDLAQVHRILSFIVTGLLLLAGSYGYHRLGATLKER